LSFYSNWWNLYNTIAAEEAIQVIKAINPKIIFPMHYQTDVLKFDLNQLDDAIQMGRQKAFFSLDFFTSVAFKLVLVVTISLIIYNIYVINQKNNEIKAIAQQIESLQTNNTILEDYNKKILNDPEELKKVARKVGMRSSKDKKVFRFWSKEGKLDIK